MHEEYYELWESADRATREVADAAMRRFVDTYVERRSKDRWRELLAKRNEKLFRHAHKLEAALDLKFCKQVEPEGIPSGVGVFYGFFDEPLLISSADAVTLGRERDAVFVLPKCGVLFSHEDRVWLCRRKA